MNARSTPYGLVSVVFACVAVAGLAAQSGQLSDDGQQKDEAAPPTFVTGTQYVRVDVYVTRDGQLVEDVRPDEITLLEDGVPQTVDTFERITYHAPDAREPGIAPRTLEASRAVAGDPRSRVFVVFIDPWHTGYVNAAAPRTGGHRAAPIPRPADARRGTGARRPGGRHDAADAPAGSALRARPARPGGARRRLARTALPPPARPGERV